AGKALVKVEKLRLSVGRWMGQQTGREIQAVLRRIKNHVTAKNLGHMLPVLLTTVLELDPGRVEFLFSDGLEEGDQTLHKAFVEMAKPTDFLGGSVKNHA